VSDSTIKNLKLIAQPCDFKNLRDGKKMPTDIDGFYDHNGTHFIYIEVKSKGKDMTMGQRIALERLCDATQRAGVHSIVLVAEHDTDKVIDVGNCTVVKYRFKGNWREAKPCTVKKALFSFIKSN